MAKNADRGLGTFFIVFVGAGTAAMTLVLNEGTALYPHDAGIGARGRLRVCVCHYDDGVCI